MRRDGGSVTTEILFLLTVLILLAAGIEALLAAPLGVMLCLLALVGVGLWRHEDVTYFVTGKRPSREEENGAGQEQLFTPPRWGPLDPDDDE